MIIRSNTPEKTEKFNFKNLNFPYAPFKHQLNAFEAIYKNDLLLESPTSSGKTDAVVYPIVDQILEEENWAIFVYPTRALVWDQFVTIKELSEKYNINVCKITPFTSVPEMENLFARNRIIIVTPDIFYYWFLRHYQHYERFIKIFFKRVKHIVFDEVHLYDTYMLLNLKLLLRSLKKLNKNLRIHCLSATIEHVIGHLYGILDFEKISGESFTGEINISAINLPYFELNYSIEEILEHKGRKVLILNSAKRVKEIYDEAKDRYENIFYVVGTRYQKEEERINSLESFKKLRNSILIASSIVEQGIDFKANTVISEDPFSLFSIIQRFGRIGRSGKNGEFILLTKKDMRHKFYNSNKILSRSEFETALEKEAKYFDPPLEKEVEMMHAMLYEVYINSSLKDVIGKAVDLDKIKGLYEKYKRHLPDPSFREPSPAVELKTGNLVSIWDVLTRNIWKRLEPSKKGIAVGYLNVTPEEFLTSKFINYIPRLSLINFNPYQKDYTKSIGTATLEIHGIKFITNGELHKRFVRNSFEIKMKKGFTKVAYFRPKTFFEETLDFPSRII
ncbi:hypothetical protein DRN58_02560 [Thermococci archaeon]|nr:MAG: hypothetical protein DRN58_02560 [Thermococci archaeon]